MSERIDHAAKAQYWLPTKGDGIMPNHVAVAQVHATLALVEQQRIANLIALATPQPGIGTGGEVSLPSWIPATDGKIAYMRLRPEIADALGMEESK
jgi:hypothetical protein